MNTSSGPHWLQQVSEWLDGRSSHQTPFQAAIGSASESELEVLADLIESKLESCDQPRRIRDALQSLASRLVLDSQNRQRGLQTYIVPPATLSRIYDQIGESDPVAASHCLQCLSAQADEESLDTLADQLVNNPPTDWHHVGLAVSPLWRSDGVALELLFERLGNAPMQPSTLVVLQDLANHAFRTHRVEIHPWQHRQQEFCSLLRQVVVRLEKLQHSPSHFGATVEDVQHVLDDSLALTVSLCDTLGLIGEASAIPVLQEAMQLSHRRIQTEAAAALARLGDTVGVNRLAELAEDPATRSRVVQYAEELDLNGAIEERFRFPQAIAESELVAWLSQPECFGIAPIRIEHLDTRTLYWPGYEEPRDCYLFKFYYELPQGPYSNVGIAGPLNHAFQASLNELSRDDQFAAFAGWHVEHEEIYEVPPNHWNPSQQRKADQLAQLFLSSDFEFKSAVALTFMLGDTALLAKLERDGRSFTGIVGEKNSFFLESSGQRENAVAELVLSIFRGRALLNAFN